MRKVIVVELLSLDGVMESSEEWASAYPTEEMEETNAAGMATSDALLLLGRVTYEEVAAFWPHQPAETPMVDHVNSVRKHVVSMTLEAVEWNNATLIDTNVAEKITELKRRSGENSTVFRSSVLVRSLLREGLLNDGIRSFEQGNRDRIELETT